MRTLDFRGTKGPIEYIPDKSEHVAFGSKSVKGDAIMLKAGVTYTFEIPRRRSRVMCIWSELDVDNLPWWEVKPELYSSLS